MTINYRFIICICTAIIFTSCVTIEPVTFKTVTNVKVEKISLNPSVDVELLLHNPNALGVKIKNVDMQIKAFDNSLGKVNLTRKIHVPREKDFTLPLTFQTTVIKAAKLLPSTLGSVINGKKVKMDFTGTITLKKWFVAKKIPFHFTEEVDTKKIKLK